MALIKCSECGKEVSDKASSCPSCGCPIGIQKSEEVNNIDQTVVESQPKKFNKKIIPIIAIVALVAVVGIIVYNFKVVQPRKIEAQNKEAYAEAIDLLEKGKYEDGQELLESISEYEDVVTILEQIKWESYVYECINDWKQWLKNPDSFTLYEVAFYLDDSAHGIYASLLGEVDYSYPAIIFRSGAQNGFGGNTTGYELFYYIKDTGYVCMGSCSSLDEDEYYNDSGELKDEDDGAMEALLCMEINELKKEADEVGTVDMERIKTLIKNDSYSTIKIIE